MTSKQKTEATQPRQKRRYVRLEIFSPVGFSSIVIDEDGRAHTLPAKKAGILLNLSGGGALISSTDDVVSGDFILVKFEIKGFETLTSILGRVKRVENCEDGERLIGIEFLTPDQIEDPALAKALARLSDDPLGFSESLRRLISRFVFQRQVDAEAQEK